MAVTNIIADALDATKAIEGFQSLLARCPTAADRKCLIMAAHDHGAISHDETGLLIQAYQLETA